MTLIRTVRPETDRMEKRFSDMLDDFFNDAVTTRRDGFVPRIDMSETEDTYEVFVQIPGMKKDDISVDLENGVLTVSGERNFKNEEKGKRFHRVETQFGAFSRSIELPDNIDPESINAKYTDGILEISVNKSEESLKKRIEIS